MTSTASAYLTCLYGAMSVPGTFLSHRQIPISTHICRCQSCRYTTGTLAIYLVPVEITSTTLSKLKSLKSPADSSRYSCPSCGSYCFVFDQQLERWYYLSDVLEGKASAPMPTSGQEHSYLNKFNTMLLLAVVFWLSLVFTSMCTASQS